MEVLGVLTGRLLINSLTSIAQVVVVGGTYFVLYRFLLSTIGIESLGVWSVVLATTSVGKFANTGLSTGVVKFVSTYLARDDRPRVVEIIQTGTLALGGFTGVIALLCYPLARIVLAWFIPEAHLIDALALLPWALLSLWLGTMAAVFQAGIDGFQRIDLRCYILMVSSLVYLGLCFALVPRFGLLGLAYAQLAQVSTLLIMASVVLRRLLPALPLVPHRFSRPLFRELFGYGLNVQVMAVGSLLLEPAAKGLISKYGGVDLTGYFEMANRMVIQLRQLINAAASALIPAVAHLEETERGAIQLVYKESYGGLFYIIWPALGLTLVSTPLFSELWIGYYQHSFVLYGILLSVGLYLGMLSSPAFYANLGAGTLRWNVVATFAMLAVTALPNLVTRGALGGTGMAVCYALAYVVGGAIILVGYHTQNHLGMWSMLPRDCLPTMVASLLGALAGLSLYGLGRRALGLPLLGVATLVIYFGLVFPPLWVHPLRKRLVGLLQREFGRKGDGDP